MNLLTIDGRLTSEPKIYPEVVGKDASMYFGIAYNPPPHASNNEALYINCNLYGNNQVKYWQNKLYKGLKVLVSGSISFKNGYITLNVKDMDLLQHTKKHLEMFGKTLSEEKAEEKRELYNEGFMDVSADDMMPWEM